jgi:hypothetical protein
MSKVGKLKNAGLVIKTPLPQAYADVIESMDDEQIDLLIGLKQQFDDAEESTEAHIAPYRVFLVPPF